MKHPEGLLYSKEHEWAKIEGDTATVGITWHAQDALGDIVFVELPAEKAEFKQMEEFGVVESVKTVSNLYAPLSGKVVAVNQELIKHPEIINDDPHGRGWIIKVQVANPADAQKLMSADEYEALLAG